jgi:hypothetical protein
MFEEYYFLWQYEFVHREILFFVSDILQFKKTNKLKYLAGLNVFEKIQLLIHLKFTYIIKNIIAFLSRIKHISRFRF